MTTAQTVETVASEGSIIERWKSSPVLSIVTPHLICVVTLLPWLLLYYFNLWNFRPHYQWFPFAIMATIAGMYLRWPTKESNPFRANVLSNVFFVFGLIFAAGAALFVEPWFGAIGVVAFVLSFCARTKDGETGKTMLPVALPLLLTLRWPLDWDIKVITGLQQFSANASSNVLDLLGYLHYLDGTILQFAERRYGVEEACSGVQSFFTLLFITTVFVVWAHRPWFRSLILIVTALFWAVLMNSLRILLIPIAQFSFGIDLSTGFAHEFLGYCVLALAILLVLSTDQFLTFVFGPIDPNTFESSNVLLRNISSFWNQVISGGTDTKTPVRERTRLPGVGTKLLIGVGTIMAALMGVVSLDAAIRSMNSGLAVRFFDNYKVVKMEHTDLPTSLGTWVSRHDQEGEGFYTFQDRRRGSDLGVRSDSWKYFASDFSYAASVSLDQPFPGWHELTRCYQNSGWTMLAESRLRKQPKQDDSTEATTDDESAWPYVQVEFTNQIGEHGFLLFCFFDAFGDPFDAPGSWNSFNSTLERIKNRFNNRVRARLFRSESYQVQVFVGTSRKLTEAERDEITANFLLAREQLRTAFLRQRQLLTGDDFSDESAEPDAADAESAETTVPVERP